MKGDSMGKEVVSTNTTLRDILNLNVGDSLTGGGMDILRFSESFESKMHDLLTQGIADILTNSKKASVNSTVIDNADAELVANAVASWDKKQYMVYGLKTYFTSIIAGAGEISYMQLFLPIYSYQVSEHNWARFKVTTLISGTEMIACVELYDTSGSK